MVNLDHFTQVSRSTQKKNNKKNPWNQHLHFHYVSLMSTQGFPQSCWKLFMLVVECFFWKPYKLKLNFDDMSILSWWLWGVCTPWNKQFAPENGWLEDEISFWEGLFSGASGLFQGGYTAHFWGKPPLFSRQNRLLEKPLDVNLRILGNGVCQHGFMWNLRGPMPTPPQETASLFEESWRDHGH